MMRRALALTVLFEVCLLTAALAVEGHAEYVTSDPHSDGILAEPPTAVVITLSEAVQRGPNTPYVHVANVTGALFEIGTTNISATDPRTISVGLRPIGPGVYTVTWGAVSAVDGHSTVGSFAFIVQNPDGTLPGNFPNRASVSRPVSAFEIGARFLSFAGLAIAIGATVLAVLLWIPGGEELGLADRPSFAWGYRALLQWGQAGALLLVVGTASLWVNALVLLPPAGLAGLVGSPFLAATAARLAFGLALLVTLWVARWRSSIALGGLRPVELLVAFALGVAGILAGTGGTHAAAAPWGLLGPAADAVHLLGVSIWVGGLLALVRIRPWLREEELLPLSRRVFAGFSELAGWSVALVLSAGVVLSLILVGSWDALFFAGYGWVVLAKISLFSPMVAVGAWNRYRILPATEEREALPGAVGKLARNVQYEAVIGAVVLSLAAILTSISPASSLAGTETFRLVSTVSGIQFEFRIYPYPSVPTQYTFEIQLWNATPPNAQPYPEYTDGLNITLRFTLPLNSSLTPENVLMEGPHGNHFVVDSSRMSQPGVWRIDAFLARRTGPPIRATFNVPIRAVG